MFHAWRQLSPERRELLAERLRQLHQTVPEERNALLRSSDFLAPLREDERRLLRGLWELRQSLPREAPPAQ